jgi:FKBP-type peptidyl-prolyl cis-trans isomerase SlyD
MIIPPCVAEFAAEIGVRMDEGLKVDDGHVVSMHYTLQVDGETIDSSEGGEPLQFIQGMGHVIPGLEHEIYAMQIGESKEVAVEPKDGYGEVDSEAFMDVPRNAFPPEVPLKPGTQLELKDKAGQPAHARVVSQAGESVRLDMNHPLAGKRLHFEVTIINIRHATNDEVAHGHVHPRDEA